MGRTNAVVRLFENLSVCTNLVVVQVQMSAVFLRVGWSGESLGTAIYSSGVFSLLECG